MEVVGSTLSYQRDLASGRAALIGALPGDGGAELLHRVERDGEDRVESRSAFVIIHIHAVQHDVLAMRDAFGAAAQELRLEVSGMAAGAGEEGSSALRQRLQQKVAQLGRGDLDRPGVAAVVGFELACVLVSGVEE